MGKGDRIRQLRENKRLTQEELARLLDTKRQTISKYEKGIVTNIPSDRIEALAEILDTTPEYILGWEEKEKAVNDDGLSDKHKALIDFAKSVPEDKAEMILRVMKSILSDEK